MDNTLIDNSTDYKLVEYLKEMLNSEAYTELRIATGYWDLPGTKLIYKELDAFFARGGKLELLIGQEPQLRSYQMRNDLSLEEKFPDFYIQRDINVLTPEYQDVVRTILQYANIEDEENSQFKIRVYGQEGEEKRFLHAKCYIFTGPRIGHGIVGSSNFTERGLEDNAELNYLETNSLTVVAAPSPYSSSKSHLTWFNEMWEKSVAWTGKFIMEILEPSPIGKKVKKQMQQEAAKTSELSPYEVYIKYLQNQLGDLADPKASALLKSFLPENYSALGYQMDAVQQCFFIMKKYKGFILADVVGLGKTVVGMLIIKKFLAEASTMGRERKVLIVTPPAIRKNWEDTIRDFDLNSQDKASDCIRFITTGSIGKLVEEAEESVPEEDGEAFDGSLEYDNYGLIMVDESHNFRNSDTQKYRDLDTLIGDIETRTGNAPYIGLLSATPQNNSPEDIKNQIYLFQRKPNNSDLPDIEGGKLDTFMANMRRQFDEARKDDSPEGRAKLQHVAKEIRAKVLDHLVVRRTRTDIKNHYEADSQNLRFPKIGEPQKLEYRLDPVLCKLFSDTINAIVQDDEYLPDPENHIGFFRYGAIAFFKSSDNKKLYEYKALTVDRVTKQLSNIMRISLVKRLESSFSAFKKSLHNLQQYTQNMIDMLAADTVYVCPDIDVNKEIEKAGSLKKAIPVLDAKIAKKGGHNLKFKAEDFNDDYLESLMHDKAIIDDLCARWDRNDLDPKMDSFKLNLMTRLFDKELNNPHGYDKPRLVIFTEAIDTLDSLCRYIDTTGHKALKVSAKSRNELQQAIKENFDANSEVRKDDYDVIVTTEVLAEGVNLHRANVILNYDTPWNATRLMQRIGRVNRIGSKEDFVHVFNFYPTTESEDQIQLVKIAYTKLQAFHTMFGEDNKVFSELEELSAADFNKLVEDEESPFGQYIADLKAFQKAKPERYQYIADMPFENLGGVITGDNGATVAVVAADNRGLTNIRLNPDGSAETISPLEMMAEMKCSEDADYSSRGVPSGDVSTTNILNCYNQHVTKMLNSKDSSADQRKALEFWHSIKNEITTEEAQNAWLSAETAVRKKHTTVIRVILKFKATYDVNGYSLFGADFDINDWVRASFSKIAEQAEKKHGQPHIVIYEEK